MTWSLTLEKNYVADALAAMVEPQVPLVPEQAVLDRLTFLSSVRAGANVVAQPPAAGQVRATLTAAVTVVPDAGAARTVAKTLPLYGPGDVIGIDPRQVIRCEPPAGAAVACGGTLAHIEFDDPTLPWAFSPPVAGQGDARLQPWIALIVVEERAGQLIQGTGGLPPQLTVGAGELFQAADAWGWAHAQVMTGQGTPAQGNASPGDAVSLDDRLTDAHGDLNLSRLICPRQLMPDTRYLACVVPTFAIGRTTGCGAAASAGLEPAWAADAPTTLPVYYHWSFETLAPADFETMVAKLKPRRAPAGVGRRAVDLSRPGGGMAAAPAAPGAVQWLDCALYSPLPAPGATAGWSTDRTQELRKKVDRGLDPQADAILPRVSPRAYGRFQRGAGTLSGRADDWYDQLNTDPLRRIAAGLGTRVVQKDADLLVEAAWSQAGEANEVNKAVVDPAQFGRFVAEAVVKKGEDRMGLEALVAITDRVQGRLDWGGGVTLAGEIAASATPRVATSAAYRRMTSAVGRLAGTAARISGIAAPLAGITTDAPGMAATRLADMRRPYARPDGVAGFSAVTLQSLPVDRVAKATGFNPAGRLTGFVPGIDRIGRGGIARPDVAVDLGQLGAGLRFDAVRRVLADADTLTPGIREALGGVLASAAPAIAADRAPELARQMDLLDAAVPAPMPAVAPAPTPARGEGGGTGPRVIVPPVILRGGNGTIDPRRIDPDVFRRVPPFVPTPTPAPARTALQRFTTFNTGRTFTPIGRGVVTNAQLVTALQQAALGTLGDLAKVPGRGTARVTRTALLAATNPARVSGRYVAARVALADRYKGWFDDGLIRPLVIDGPRFQRPMFEALRDYDRNWLAPGLGQIGQTDFVTLLVGNARFAEAFMVGLSDEMGRELMWRGFPVDRRATFFSRFWNAQADDLKPDIHLWSSSSRLGDHSVPPPSTGGGDGSADRVVLMIRGEVVRTFPDLIVLAQQATGKGQVPFGAPPGTGTGSPLFRARLDSETLVVGFDLTVAQIAAAAGGTPWWFLIAEHPGAPRFGLDPNDDKIATGFKPGDANFDALEWGQLPMRNGSLAFGPGPAVPPIWGQDGAANAQVLLQSPVRAAFDAKALIADIKGAS
jgi:hypothetical protein